MIDVKWQYAKKEQRKALINKILFEEKEQEPSTVISTEETVERKLKRTTIMLLSNFSNNGFMILYYILKDIQNNFTRGLNTEEYIARNNKLREAQESIAKNNYYYNDLYEIYTQCDSRKSEWKRQLADKCHDMVADIFRNDKGEADMDMALKYVYTTNAEIRSKFLWDVFTNEEIMRNVFVPGKAE